MQRKALLTAIVATAALLAGAVTQAAESERSRSWEATIQLIGTGSEKSGGNGGSGIDFDSAVGFGFGVAYNFSQHLSVGFDASFVEPDYTATVVPEGGDAYSFKHKANIFNGALNGTWNILKGNFTPYVQLGIGWTYVDSNVSDGPPETGCWWDPWWGYVCANFYDTYDDNRFSWNGGVGLRYEFENRMYLKGSVNKVFIDGGNNGSDPDFDLWKLELGWMMR